METDPPEAIPVGGDFFLSSMVKEVGLEFGGRKVHTAFHCRACGRCVEIDHCWQNDFMRATPEDADYVGEDFTPKGVGRLCSECFVAKNDWRRGSERKVPFEFCRGASGKGGGAPARFVAGRRRGAAAGRKKEGATAFEEVHK